MTRTGAHMPPPQRLVSTLLHFATVALLLNLLSPDCRAQLSGEPVFIRVDQFGYLPEQQKVAIIADPQVGFDANKAYTPGPVVELRREPDDAIAFSAAPVSWKAGATHADSGDKCWHFDFSSVATPGRYHVYDPSTKARSDSFQIAKDVYRPVVVQAARMFFYQRSGFAKKPPYVQQRLADPAAFMRDNQDPKCRLVSTPNDASTERDLRGGWFDAGDYNKYVTFAWDCMQTLLLAYEEHPKVWGDDHGIPESGNGIPDILDEIKWETDWFLRMQQADGSLLNRVHSIKGASAASPASADTSQRCYGAASTSSTIAGADVLAHAAIVFGSLGRDDTHAYSSTLRAAAIRAWDWARQNPKVLYDDTPFGGSLEKTRTDDEIAAQLCRAAVKLYALTGEPRYREFFDANYRKAHLFGWNFAYVFEATLQDALLYYLRIPGGTETVKADIARVTPNAIRTGGDNLPQYLAFADPYFSFSSAGDYTWGACRWKADKGSMFAVMNVYGLDTANQVNYREAAAGYLHYLHGANPLALVYLSNLREYGAARSVSEFYHHWFSNGSEWDSSLLSPKGPPPGYIPGGPNPRFKPDSSYSGSGLTPPMGQPAHKSYKDWNTSWPENSWEVTEPAIYYQASYLRLLAGYLDEQPATDVRLTALSARAQLREGEDALIPGFAVSGPKTSSVLARVTGPNLAFLDVPNFATDPSMILYSLATVPATKVLENDDWENFADQASLGNAVAQTGAYPFKPKSKDSSVIASLQAGPYSVVPTTKGAQGGIGLVELFEDPSATSPNQELIGLSCRSYVGTEADILITGFAVGGSERACILIRASGPAIAAAVTKPLDDPEIALYSGSQVLAYNDNWEDGSDLPLIVQATRAIGLSSFGTGSKDAALLVRLNRGNYTVHLRGKGPKATGIGLAELYLIREKRP